MMTRVLIVLTLGLLFVQAALAATDSRGNVFYRYINDDGVKVMNHTLPAEYAQKGYEVVSLSGKVIEVVDPAPTAEEAARLALENRSKAELEEWDKSLRRRYSRVTDIEAAKKRKLASIHTNINILSGNLSKLNVQLQQQQGQAANSERRGHKVPEKLLTNITNLELEIKTTEDQIATRNKELEELSEKFDRDIERFKIISPKK
jgi:chromosome segregation ATPase